MSRIVLNRGAIEAIGKQPAASILDDIGAQVAGRAAMQAPKRTGAGAASIHQETSVDEQSAVSRISWDDKHFYLYFHELGTSRMPARPFLRPALDGTYTP